MPVRPALGLFLAATTLVGTGVTGVVSAAPAAAGTSCVPPPVAHRGDSSQAPENTLPSFGKALAAGVRRLELDVRFTNGDVPVVMHDATVDRTTNGSGEVATLTLEQVRSLDAGSWFSKAYRGTRVPTLYDVLSLAKRRGATVMVELKTEPTAAQMTAFLDRVRRLSMGRSITVTSFIEPAITDVRAAAPDLSTAIIDNPRYRTPASVLQFGHTYLINASSVTKARSASWRRAGISVRPWTVDTVNGWQRMALDKASATITNRPASYLAWARTRCR